jgi:hypothetical protein
VPGVKVHAPEPFAVVVPSEFEPSNTSTVALASEVPEMVGVVSLVRAPLLGEVILGAEGAAVSTATVTVVEKPLSFPAISVAFARKDFAPSARLLPGVNDQLPEPFAEVVPRELTPSNTSTDELASAVPVIVGVLSLVVDPFVGADMLGAAGADVSTVSETALDATPVLLPASVALAVIE